MTENAAMKPDDFKFESATPDLLLLPRFLFINHFPFLTNFSPI
jgi:hypothetical protein